MRRLFSLFVLMCVVLPTASAFGAGIQLSSLNSNVDLGDMRYSMNTSDEGGGRYYLSLNLDIASGVIGSSSVSITRNSSDLLQGSVNAHIYGLLDAEPKLVDWKSQSTNIFRRGGLDLNTHAGIGSSQQILWSDKDKYVYGDIFSSSNLGVSLSQIAGIDYAYASYHEYEAYKYDWIDQDGGIQTEYVPAKFWMDATWYVEFANAASANMAYSFQPMVVSNLAVPEPSTFVLMALGLLGIAIAAYRRRKHS